MSQIYIDQPRSGANRPHFVEIIEKNVFGKENSTVKIKQIYPKTENIWNYQNFEELRPATKQELIYLELCLQYKK